MHVPQFVCLWYYNLSFLRGKGDWGLRSNEYFMGSVFSSLFTLVMLWSAQRDQSFDFLNLKMLISVVWVAIKKASQTKTVSEIVMFMNCFIFIYTFLCHPHLASFSHVTQCWKVHLMCENHTVKLTEKHLYLKSIVFSAPNSGNFKNPILKTWFKISS